MSKIKTRHTAAQRRTRRKAKEGRQSRYEWVFMNGKQVRIMRQPTIEGMSIDEFIEQNADPTWLHQNEMWELMNTDVNRYEYSDGDEILSSYAEDN
jgi:hypothetical protein